ncbi:PEP-CTERM sorting domain-containing protein [Gloeocapsa sp. PCC 73106]|uniref:PEP-CTERM sorting domain-containing protein n=1 Tax=Gloeocapsa sp. PCC 73106 TaxID=102232 RepID=UPI0002ACAD1E|nr:PEP-CTERM sorting domain-containing protein [Gloeocapsa sp. PCC 73106]ELR99160.1 PEP-CTERM putative exosortase interaction domain-containing protein [Gloeocapsa sp. PCC 73106]
MRFKNISTVLSLTLVTLATVDVANATSYLATNDGIIGTIDTSTGVFTPVFTNGVEFGDIAFSNGNGLFANSLSANGEGDRLFRVNLNANTLTLVGSEDVSNLAALEFNRNTNVLFGGSFSGGLYTVNTSNGDATLVSNIPDYQAAGDLAFDPSTDSFFATSSTPDDSTLFSITPDGTASQIGNGIGFANVFGIILEGNTLYGFTDIGQQIIIDPTTGVGTFDRDVTGTLDIIVGASQTEAIPEPSSLFGIFGALGGILALKRKYGVNPNFVK